MIIVNFEMDEFFSQLEWKKILLMCTHHFQTLEDYLQCRLKHNVPGFVPGFASDIIRSSFYHCHQLKCPYDDDEQIQLGFKTLKFQ
jgi:hypothetical protein